MLEVSESMYCVACRQFEKGMSIEEISKITQHPIELVEKWYEQYKLKK